MKSLATLSFTLLTLLSFAQPNTTSNRFWMAYMDNITLMFNGDPAFGVWISSDTEVVGTISVPQTGLTIEFDGGPGSF